MSSTTDPTGAASAAAYTGPKGPLWEWTARVHIDKQELESATAICLFLGQPPQDPKDWLVAPNLAGAHHVLVSPGRRRVGRSAGGGGGYGSGFGVGSGSRRQAGSGGGGGGGGGSGHVADVTEGFVHLNPSIARLSGLGSFDPERVVPYLEKELEWRVQKARSRYRPQTPLSLSSSQSEADTTPIEVDSLEIVVFATPLTYPPGGMFPVPGDPRQYNHITYGKTGGSRDSEDKL